MPLKSYGVLKGRVVNFEAETSLSTPHFQVLVDAAGESFRAAINVRSKGDKPELLFLADEHFQHPITSQIVDLDHGFHRLPSRPGGAALDFIRSNLFNPEGLRALPHDLPGEDNDLNEKLDFFVRRAKGNESADIYLFGEPWGPEANKKDKIFGFLPGRGIHDIHMNQGNPRHIQFQDNGVYQDGALLFHFAQENRWVAIFLAFQTQAWHTDDRTGNPLTEEHEGGEQPREAEPFDGAVRIVAALVNPSGEDQGQETVTLLNTTAQSIDLAGWHLANRIKEKEPLAGQIAGGGTLTVRLQAMPLGNKGGIITLLDQAGLKTHGVSYTREEASAQGRTIVF